MSQEQIIQMAREADLWLTSDERIAAVERFAKLVVENEKAQKAEPVAWVSAEELLVMKCNALAGAKDWRINVGLVKQDGDVGLYTSPPPRQWVGLTDDEVEDVYRIVRPDVMKFWRICEAKLKEKNT